LVKLLNSWETGYPVETLNEMDVYIFLLGSWLRK